jgi:hypothetical protein
MNKRALDRMTVLAESKRQAPSVGTDSAKPLEACRQESSTISGAVTVSSAIQICGAESHSMVHLSSPASTMLKGELVVF